MTRVERYGPWAVVTGATAGLGEEFAKQLAAEGFRVVLVGRRADRLAALREHLRTAHGAEARTLCMDLAQEGAAEALDAATSDLDVGLLINNAGFGYMGRFVQQDPVRLAEMIRLNCQAVMLLAHRFGNRLAARGRGAMVIVSSVAGFQATPYMCAYGATKAFDLSLAEGLANELKRSGVDVMALCPGSTRTEFGQVAQSAGGGGGMDPRAVVRSAIRALGRRRVVVTGWTNKLAALTNRLFPRRFVVYACGLVLRGNVPPDRR